MLNRIVLSICIPLHNRCEYLAEHLQEILRVDSEEFDVIISDTSEPGRRFEDVTAFHDERLKIYPAPETVPAMENGYLALEHADGIFALHLNDRDCINCKELPTFISFLKKHQQYSGGVCKYINKAAPILCDSVQDAIMCVPYFSLHPTGLFFNVERYKDITDRKEFFARKYGTHPHDIVLGRLSQWGGMIIYTLPIWKMAENDFLRKNKSGFEKGEKTFFFEPEQRLKELIVVLSELQKLGIDPELKIRKKDQVITNYLFLATFNYFYHFENNYLAAHYGIPQKHFSPKQKSVEIDRILKTFGRSLGFSHRDYARYGFRCYKRWLLYKLESLANTIPIQAIRTKRSAKKKRQSCTFLRLG